jgi:3-oxoacyl-[acyl-carrier protein] reductase
MDLRGKVAIVTGSSSPTGVGGTIAKMLAGRGCNVAVNYVHNRDGAEEVVTSCVAAGSEAQAVQANVASDSDCRRLVSEVVQRWGRLDVLVNNAAITRPVPLGELESIQDDEFQKLYAVNVVGSFQMARAAAPHLKSTGDAAIVNISSAAAFLGNGSSIAYAASKGALNTLTLSLARTLAPEVRVNAICPGGLLGNWTQKLMSKDAYEARLHEAETRFPLRRGVWPLDVANQVLFLIEGATTLTGEFLRTDSGGHLL